MTFSALARSTVCVLMMSVATSTAYATGYFAIEGSSLTLEERDKSGISPRGLRLRLGTHINRLMDVEGHYGFSFSDKDEEDDRSTSTNYYGLFVKAYLPVGHNSALFALAGMSTVNLSQKLSTAKNSDSRSGGSFGFGMETRLSENADLTADYMSYIRDEGLFEEVSSFNFGLKLYF